MRLIEPPTGGGIRSLHELAFAAAVSGRDVELRGAVSREVYDELAAATGATVSLPDEARPPSGDDVVVLPEVIEPLGFSRLLWSDARLVLLCLAPPGLLGWPLWDGWRASDLLIVEPPDVVVTARRALAMAGAFGLTVWTPMPFLTRLAREEGLECTWIGNGTPGPPPEPGDKSVDVAWLRANRWAPLAESAAVGIAGSVDAIEEVSHTELLRRVGRARILLWPSRIEGHGRIAAEARLVGTVPVALGTNPFAVGLAEATGAVAVASVDALAPAATALLAEPDRLAALAERGRAAALLQVDWEGYVVRLATALELVDARPHDASAAGRVALGRHVDAALAGHRTDVISLRSDLAGRQDHAEKLEAEAEGLEMEVEGCRAEIDRLGAEIDRLGTEIGRLGREIGRLDREIAYRDGLIAAQERRIAVVSGERDGTAGEFGRFRRRRSVRLATWIADRLSSWR